jgi:ABC-type cobalt transport system, ATPase component
MESVIQIKDLYFEYEENAKTIDNISFNIEKGKYTTILGHNGSGKSTIAKLISGLLEKKSGEIIVNGIILSEETLYDVRKHIGIVFQNPDNQFIGSTVRDDIAFGLENKCVDPKLMDGIIEKYAQEVSMIDFLNHEPTKLSGGQKQRVAIAGILAMSPDIIILDEATSMLDPKGKKEINQLVSKINAEKQMTVISITHDIEEAVLSDCVILLDHGKIDSIGTPEEIFRDSKKIKKLGLDVPFAFQLSNALTDKAVIMETEINQEMLVKKLWQLHSNK